MEKKEPLLLIQVNDKALAEEISDSLGKEKFQTVLMSPGGIPEKAPFLFVLKYGEDNDEVCSFLNAPTIRRWETPAFVVEEKFNPDHSRNAWLCPQVVGYLVWDEKEKGKSLEEIKGFAENRIRKRDQINTIKSLHKIGGFVGIKEKDFQKHNLVSLFVGKMRDFMVELKFLCDTARPKKLGKNYIRDIPDLVKVLEYEKAKRLGEDDFEYKRKNIPLTKIIAFLEKSNTDGLFKAAATTQGRGVILIRGESGTGKSIIANFIHEYIYKGEPESGKLKTIVCTNIGKQLLESQLFGCLTGAFTDAMPQPGAILEGYNGTVFFDEIGDLSDGHQAALLQYLQDGKVSPMGWVGDPIYVPAVIVAATNRDLEKRVRDGLFREDLYHRLGVYVRIPSLRERLEDRVEEIERLIDFVMQNPLINPGRTVKTIEAEIFDHLKTHPFPGNFRELEHLLRWGVVLARKDGLDVLTCDHVRQAQRDHKAVIREDEQVPVVDSKAE